MAANALVWFRADLRTADNTALLRAAADARASGGAVIGLFMLSPAQWREHGWGGAKVDFVLRTLRTLSADLWKLGVPLLVERADRFADAPAAVVRLAKGHGCGRVYFGREYEVNERARDERVLAACRDAGIGAVALTDAVLMEPGDVLTGEGRSFSVFTPFRRALYRELEARGGVVARGRPRKQMPPPGVTPSEIPAALDGFTPHIKDPERLWPAGEAAAMARLTRFVERSIGGYKERRDFPGARATSALSPYLAVGAVSPRQCVAAAAVANGGRLESPAVGPTAWISEIAWREFYKHVVIGFPWVCKGRAFRRETDAIRWDGESDRYRAWCEGRTGVPLVDAGMRQLLAEGWMHNRVRMVVAMHLTKDLFIDWRLGERHFAEHLIDLDFASNNGGWQWSASTGTDAAPYFRVFNPVAQSRRFDPEGAYIRRYVPELARLDGGEDGPIHDPWDAPMLVPAALDYPRPIADRAAAKTRVMAAFKGLAAPA
jgi:deoxyribodipyrimidine photo-lyase